MKPVMANLHISSATPSLQDQLNREISQLYRHFLAGELEPQEFSELVDELIGMHSLMDVAVAA